MKLAAATGVAASHILVVFNGTTTEQEFTSPALIGLALKLHPIQRKSVDPIVRTSNFNAKKGQATVPPSPRRSSWIRISICPRLEPQITILNPATGEQPG